MLNALLKDVTALLRIKRQRKADSFTAALRITSYNVCYTKLLREDNCPQEAGPASNNGCPDWVELDLSNILFDFDKSDLRPEAKAELDKLAATLDASKEYEIVVGGHTDNVGTEAYNMGLSERRAQSVVKYLLMKGVNNAYVRITSYNVCYTKLLRAAQRKWIPSHDHRRAYP